MATSWKSQQGNGEYRLQFETDNEEKYKLVEKAAQMAMDGKTKADFVEVVRCKDCKHRYYYKDRIMCAKNAHMREYGCVGLTATTIDGFCNHGERENRRCHAKIAQ